jgi:hypothetical protein
MMFTTLERYDLMVTMTYIRLPTSSLCGIPFIASISSNVCVVKNLQDSLLESRGVVIGLQFSMLKDLRIFPIYLG